MSNRVTELETRIANLKKLIEEEQKGDNCKTYIEDLKDSIRACEAQMPHAKANPDGYQFVNGV